MENQNVHLSNAAGDIFPLPFDISIHYQQHSVALGIALTLIAAYVFCVWQRKQTFAPLLLLLNVASFGLVFLGHAVFGAMAAASAGLTLAALWLRNPTWNRFLQGILFTLGVTMFAFAHGGMLTPGEQYGPPGAPVAIRDVLGYVSGGLLDQANWILAGFGFLFLFSLLTLYIWVRKRGSSEGQILYLSFYGLFALVSLIVPQVAFFSHAGGIEEQTEISKFFFCTHLGLAMFSVLAVDYLGRRLTGYGILPFFVLTAISPLAVSYSASFDEEGNWTGIYRSPYAWQGGVLWQEAGNALNKIKRSNRDQYYDFSRREATSGYLNELLVYGGSVFTLTPTRYEVTGFGFLISEKEVEKRIVQESRMARFIPGSAEESGTDWIYGSLKANLSARPAIVRSRFRKMVSEGILEKQFSNKRFELFEVKESTRNLDDLIELHWTPKIVTQSFSDWDSDGQSDTAFFDYKQNSIQVNDLEFNLSGINESDSGFPIFYLGRVGEQRVPTLFVGLMSDANYSRGATVSQMIRRYMFAWRRFEPESEFWSPVYRQGYWMLPMDVPFVGDHDGNGSDELLSYRPKSSRWNRNGNRRFKGPSLPEASAAIPFMGRFFSPKGGDRGLWSPLNGSLVIESRENGEQIKLDWGGKPGDVFLPGDYDGDGMDELGIWQKDSNKWWIRKLPSGPNRGVEFGSPTGVPLPFDYDGDGTIDLAYWEAEINKIFISFDFGNSIGKTIDVPENSIPVFVNMY